MLSSPLSVFILGLIGVCAVLEIGFVSGCSTAFCAGIPLPPPLQKREK